MGQGCGRYILHQYADHCTILLEPVMLHWDDTAFLEYFLNTLPGFLNSS
jgi:hypothetical protein